MNRYDRMADIIPERAIGKAAVEHFEVSDADANLHNLRCSIQPGGRLGMIEPGRYARLRVRGSLMMSDTPYELLTNLDAVADAKGDVLIGGLGLGLVVLAMLRKPEVRSVTVLENSPDVVALIEDPLRRHLTGTQSAGLVIFTADVKRWEPSKENIHRFDYIYLDIWPNVSVDDYDEHVLLRRRYRKWLRTGTTKIVRGRIGSWRFEHLQELKRSGRWR